MGNGVKAPANLAGSHIKRTDVARRRGQVLRHQPTDDEQVLINNSRSCGRDGDLARIAAQTLPQIHAPSLPETRNQ